MQHLRCISLLSESETLPQDEPSQAALIKLQSIAGCELVLAAMWYGLVQMELTVLLHMQGIWPARLRYAFLHSQL